MHMAFGKWGANNAKNVITCHAILVLILEIKMNSCTKNEKLIRDVGFVVVNRSLFPSGENQLFNQWTQNETQGTITVISFPSFIFTSQKTHLYCNWNGIGWGAGWRLKVKMAFHWQVISIFLPLEWGNVIINLLVPISEFLFVISLITLETSSNFVPIIVYKNQIGCYKIAFRFFVSHLIVIGIWLIIYLLLGKTSTCLKVKFSQMCSFFLFFFSYKEDICRSWNNPRFYLKLSWKRRCHIALCKFRGFFL